MAPSGRTKTRRRRRRRNPARSHFKKQHHPQNKQQEIFTGFSGSCFSTSSKDSSKDPEVADNVCSTPKGHKFRIPEISTCPPAPKKPRVLTNCSLRRSLSFFAPPDLDVFFCLALRDVSVSFVC